LRRTALRFIDSNQKRSSSANEEKEVFRVNHDASPEYEESPCHYQRVINLVSSKWTLLIFYELEFGSQRYADLQRRIKGVTKKC